MESNCFNLLQTSSGPWLGKMMVDKLSEAKKRLEQQDPQIIF
jgi:hypothetical protein